MTRQSNANASRYLHLLDAAAVDLLQREGEVAFDVRIFDLGAATVQSSEGHVHVTVHSVVEFCQEKFVCMCVCRCV